MRRLVLAAAIALTGCAAASRNVLYRDVRCYLWTDGQGRDHNDCRCTDGRDTGTDRVIKGRVYRVIQCK